MPCTSVVIVVVAVTLGVALVMCLGERLCMLGSY
jgi:hypothetical protein